MANGNEKRISDLQVAVESQASIHDLFSRATPSRWPLDIGDDCAELLRSCWDARRNRSLEFTEADVVRLCAAFRAIGKGDR